MSRKKKKPARRWLHKCSVNKTELVIQSENCPYCSRIRTPQAEQAYGVFAQGKGI